MTGWRRARWRRHASAAAALVGALLLVSATRPAPAATVPVVVAARDLRTGARLIAGDLALGRWPADLAPPGASSQLAALVGRRIGGPIAVGEAVTATRLLSAAAAEIPTGQVVTTLPGQDPALAAWLEIGRTVDVLEPVTGAVLAREATVLATPEPPPGTAGGWSASVGDLQARTLAVAVTATEARAIAAAAGDLDRPVLVVVHPEVP